MWTQCLVLYALEDVVSYTKWIKTVKYIRKLQILSCNWKKKVLKWSMHTRIPFSKCILGVCISEQFNSVKKSLIYLSEIQNKKNTFIVHCSILLWKLIFILYTCTLKGYLLGFEEGKSDCTSSGTMPICLSLFQKVFLGFMIKSILTPLRKRDFLICGWWFFRKEIPKQ